MCSAKRRKNEVATILNESRMVVQSYMVGLIIELIIVATINSIGFLILGHQIRHFPGRICRQYSTYCLISVCSLLLFFV